MAVSNEQGLYIRHPCSKGPDALMDRAGDARNPMGHAPHDTVRRILGILDAPGRAAFAASARRAVPVAGYDRVAPRAFSGHMGPAPTLSPEAVTWTAEQVTQYRVQRSISRFHS